MRNWMHRSSTGQKCGSDSLPKKFVWALYLFDEGFDGRNSAATAHNLHAVDVVHLQVAGLQAFLNVIIVDRTDHSSIYEPLCQSVI